MPGVDRVVAKAVAARPSSPARVPGRVPLRCTSRRQLPVDEVTRRLHHDNDCHQDNWHQDNWHRTIRHQHHDWSEHHLHGTDSTGMPAKLTRIGGGLILLLGALTAVGPFTIDLYLAAFPQITSDMGTNRPRCSSPSPQPWPVWPSANC